MRGMARSNEEMFGKRSLFAPNLPRDFEGHQSPEAVAKNGIWAMHEGPQRLRNRRREQCRVRERLLANTRRSAG